MADEAAFRRQVAAFAEQIGELHERALAEYSPVVSGILVSGSRDVREIERALDGLLDFCGHAGVLQLYRQLCRHYHGIDPAAAASHVDAYRAMYGEGGPGSDDGN